MTERLAQFGVQELSLAEQGEVLGGDGFVKWVGWALGFVAGAVVEMLSRGYDNPRYSGQWMG